MVLTSSRIVSCELWLRLMRKTSAPASNRRRIMALSEDAGPNVARILIRRRRLMACFRAPRPAASQTRPGPYRPVGWGDRRGRPGHGRLTGGARRARRRLFAGFGQLHRPGPLFAGVNLEEAGAVEPARQAILGALDGEFLVARAHEGLSRPLAAPVVIERVDVIEPRDEGAAKQRL